MISYESIINSLDEAVILFDAGTHVVFLNKTAEELIGKASKDVLGRRVGQVITAEKPLPPLIRKTIAEGRSFRARSVAMDIGRPINADFSLSPFLQQGRIEGALLAIAQNIGTTDSDAPDFDAIVYLIGSIAHEIKNPLGGIKGAAQLLRNKTQNASLDEYTDLIIRETDRLNAILHDYLTLCKQPAFNAVNLHEVIEKAVSVLAIPLEQAGVTLSRHYDPSLPQVQGDEGKLLQVFLNVIKNAVESMKSGGMVEISTYPSRELVRLAGRVKRMAVIAFRDTGKGIPKEALGKIFMPFYTRKKQGTGIGLAFSNKIIKDHGGLIKVRSEPGRGTTFLIFIPFEEGDGKKDTRH